MQSSEFRQASEAEIGGVPDQRMLALMNSYIVRTTELLSSFAIRCEDRLQEVHFRCDANGFETFSV